MFDIKSLNLKTEDEIISSWTNEEIIVVSVLCTTYNHEHYIEDAIKSFLMQETDFAFEIIINDDASTDNTREVIEYYRSHYPHIIQVICHSKNKFSLGVRPISFALPLARGKFVALCEGDDYWIDEHKLANQVSFLASNDDFVLHVYDAYEEEDELIDENSSKLTRLSIKNGEYTKMELKEEFVLLPLTSCFKNDIELPFQRYLHKSINGDVLLQGLLSFKGKAFVDSAKKVAVYRVHEGGIWSTKDGDYIFFERLHTHLVQIQMFAEYKYIRERKTVSVIIELCGNIGVFCLFRHLTIRIWAKVKKLFVN